MEEILLYGKLFSTQANFRLNEIYQRTTTSMILIMGWQIQHHNVELANHFCIFFLYTCFFDQIGLKRSVRARKHQYTNKKQTQNQTLAQKRHLVCCTYRLCFFFCFVFVFLYFVQIRPPPFLTPHLIRPSLAAVFWVGNLSRKPLHRAMPAYCQYHCNRPIHTCMICFNNFFRILMNVQIYAMLIAWRSLSAMITIYYRSIRYFSRSLSQNILQRLLQFGSQPSGASNNNILNSLNYMSRNLAMYLTISGRVIVFGTWSFTKRGKFDFARGNLSLQSTFGCNPQKLFSNWKVI